MSDFKAGGVRGIPKVMLNSENILLNLNTSIV